MFSFFLFPFRSFFFLSFLFPPFLSSFYLLPTRSFLFPPSSSSSSSFFFCLSFLSSFCQAFHEPVHHQSLFTTPRPSRRGGGGLSTYISVGEVLPGSHHPNPGLNQKPKICKCIPWCKPNICKHSLYLCCTQLHLNRFQCL